ncbi:MAG TPA: NAD(P)/FAD-dependent oxidoreductase [Pseudonocardiaceae bacterium]
MPGKDKVYSVAIIGAGFSGLGMAIRLKRSGEQDFVILEEAHDVGGTWRENTYPGCACDIPSYLYSYSFEPNPNWTRQYPRQQEIWDYLRHCAAKYALTTHLRFGTRLAAAEFDDGARLWRLTTAGGEVLRARVVVSAMGPLHLPSIPRLKGLESFRGTMFHSARWNHDHDLTGRRVAVVGTGASAVQFVPRIAGRAARVTVFQRTAPWVMPKSDRRIGRAEHTAYRLVPPLQRLRRAVIYWLHELRVLGMVFDPRLMRLVERLARAHLRRAIDDPRLRAAVTPDHTIGCKRILISNDYYPALARPDVDLVTDHIAEVREHSVVTADGTEHEVDTIILATGFHVVDALDRIPITGANGRTLRDAWRDGVEAYYGVAVSGFPNLFLLAGPNTGLGHNSIVFMIEAQVHYLLRCLELLRGKENATIDVRPEAQRRFNDALQRRLGGTVWGTGCRSWYLDEQGRNRTIWPGFTWSYWLRTRTPRTEDLEVRSERTEVPA